MARSFLDDLGRAQQESRRKGQAEIASRARVEDELEACRLLNRQVSRLRALQDAIDIVGDVRGVAVRFRGVGGSPPNSVTL